MVGGCSGTWVLPPPYDTSNGIYDDLVPRPSCYDGLQNGDETGVDTGGHLAPRRPGPPRLRPVATSSSTDVE